VRWLTPPVQLIAALLAAGSSRRFGTSNKLMEIWQGKPLIAHAAHALRGIPARRHIAICAPHDIALHTLLKSSGFEVCINMHAETGLSSSVRVAAQCAMRENAEGVLIALGDMPHVSQAHYAALMGSIAAQDITASRHVDGGANMPPVCFGRSAIAALLNVDGDYGARDMIADAPFITAPAWELRDFDVPSDFA
jgi:molybdenum cofactor cytidylyltransferase